MFTQTGSRKARNIEARRPRGLSAVDDDDPYRQCDLRGRVGRAHRRRGGQAVADELSVKYTGAPFPWRSPNTVAYVITPRDVPHGRAALRARGALAAPTGW